MDKKYVFFIPNVQVHNLILLLIPDDPTDVVQLKKTCYPVFSEYILYLLET